jgi:starvation-inducible DNA-binding protein
VANDVAESLRRALADTWAFYFTSHSFHWNVQGPLFRELHSFFGDIYEDAQDAVDGLAEQLRALDEFAPTSLAEIDALSTIDFPDGVPDAIAMVTRLGEDNEKVLASLGEAQSAAADAGEEGLANYLQDRLNTHKKWGWMLKATAEGKPTKARHAGFYSR